MGGFRAWVRGLGATADERHVRLSWSETPASPEGSTSFAESHNDFTLALYRQLLPRPGNLVFSPFSIRAALGMTYAGARGETAVQMSGALRFASSGETLHGAFAEIIQRLNAAAGGSYEMVVANSLWGQHGVPLRPEFLDLIARHYGGGMYVVDLHSGAEATLNRWVEDKTKQKIRELIPPGGLEGANLVVVNAICFKGMWVLQFHKDATRDEAFYLEGGRNMQTPLMHRHTELRHFRAKGYQAVDLDYRGEDLSMLVLLPDKKDGLRDLEARLSARMLHDCVEGMLVRDVKLFLPRFRMACETVELGTPLRALGMPLAFTRYQADFSGINGYEPPRDDSLFIASVFHKAFVEVNEEGTEAAAATAILMRAPTSGRPPKPPPVPVFRADHPFLFVIRDRKSSAILFLGRVADPSLER